jgi:prepilin-type N-terminal cleavage/methylation domain-containing protein
MLRQKFKDQSGFTLMEILIVVILMGILAMVVIPQISVSSEDTRVSTLQSNLTQVRNLLEVYYAQHAETYPGEIDHTTGSGAPADDAAAAVSFVAQLAQYTKTSGEASTTDRTNFPVGPYIKSKNLPPNPFNNQSSVKIDSTTTDITARTYNAGDETDGYKFFVKTGILIACDGGTSNGVAHNDY